MDIITKQDILNKLKEIYCSLVADIIEWPRAYCKDISNIRAIALECDPSNMHDKNLKYVFGIETETTLLKQFFAGIQNNLSQIGLSQNDIYIKNLCQNYFTVETSENCLWQTAAKIWLPYLKELDMLPINKDVPVFLTVEDLYMVLMKEGSTKYKPKELYSNPELLPINAIDNYLNRPLFPLYRGGRGLEETIKLQPAIVEVLR